MLPIALMLLICIGMPLGYAWRLWRLDEPSRVGCLAVAAEAICIVALVCVVGRWDIAGYYTRFVLGAIFLGTLVIALRRHAARPWRQPGTRPLWRTHFPTLMSAALIGAVLVYAVAGSRPLPKSHEVAFPLRGERFMIGQGGANRLLNHHAGHAAQRHAVDITAINDGGFRATGLRPTKLERYVILGANVVSPCTGTVAASKDGHPDLMPPESDEENPAGNHVVIACEGIRIEVAHLQRGSVAVNAGDTISACHSVGRVGNSGNTTEPHLHVHAIDARTGQGVPLTFGGRTPVRNGLFGGSACPGA